jgi:hypothetical protein
MLQSLIPNNTPYLGKIKLKFERYPNYSGGTAGKLNSTILNLGFTKLVSRIIPTKTQTGWAVDPKKVALINQYTDGVIGQHRFGKDFEHVLENSFLSRNGDYIGDINQGWWYLQNGLTVCEEHPARVALKWRTSRFDKTVMRGTDGLEGYYGYSHRGGSLFKIGDRIFDPKYKPKEKDYYSEDWKNWQKEYADLLDATDDIDLKWLERDGISSVIPFSQRGERQIMNWDHAREAALNLSKYLS